LPGTRVATFTAAGLFSTSVTLFAVVTGCAVLIWVTAIFSLTKLLGQSGLSWFVDAQNKSAPVIITILCLLGLITLARRYRVSLPLFVRRVSQWEFWP
jgi:membrane protein DedA with SNARE-associated domain